MRDPAPPYANEGPYALWHVSENPGIERFEPHVAATSDRSEPLIWAVDTRHLPLYWFPRDCPRGTFWADAETTPKDIERLLGNSSRVHVVEETWLGRLRAATVFAYRLPADAFEPHPEVGGYWISHTPIEPAGVETLDGLVDLHERAAIELRVLPNIWPLWNEVATSTLEFSGIRLHNAEPAK